MRPICTSAPPASIWCTLPENIFRQNLVTLQQRTNAVVIDSQTFSAEQWLAQQVTRPNRPDEVLPLTVEQQVADDLAFLTAVEEGAQSVSATTLEQYPGVPTDSESFPSVVIRIAAVDSLNPSVRNFLRGLCDQLAASAAAARSLPLQDKAVPEKQRELVFNLIVKQHYLRILGRLRSTHWTKPPHLSRSHKKPLWQDFDNLIHRVQHIYPGKSQRSVRQAIEFVITNLQQIYISFEDSPTRTHDEECNQEQKKLSLTPRIHTLVAATYTFCHIPSIRLYARALTDSPVRTAQISAALKTLHQLEKIGAYLRIARSLVDAAIQYPWSFRRIEIAYLDGYESVPTKIAYESWAKTLHVHAEVQLAVFYDLRWQCQNEIETTAAAQIATPCPVREGANSLSQTNPTMVGPRALGTSKRLCYLCYLFLAQHSLLTASSPTTPQHSPPHFFPSTTHGRLYDQWTIPDLAEYNDYTIQRYRDIITKMDRVVRGMIADTDSNGGEEEDRGNKGKGKGMRKRIEPMTSRQNLLGTDESRRE